MSFCECLTKFLQSLDCRKQITVSEPIPTLNIDAAEQDNLAPQPDLELALQTDLDAESEPEPAEIEEIKPLTIEEADADDTEDSEEEIPIIEDRNARNSHYSEDLEFECDERELIKILDEKEKEDEDEDRHRFSMY
jgi:hypothetical protein